MHSTFMKLLRDAPVLLDGSWGTELQRRGLGIGACPDLWNLEVPAAVQEVARSYRDAGCQVVLTNTFGASPYALSRHGQAERAHDINLAGGRLSVEAVAGEALVFGSMGPSGAMLVTGQVTVEELESGFKLQAEALAEGGVDGLVIETMSDLDEARAAVRAAVSTGLAVAACMVFDSGRDSDRTMMGTTPEQAVTALQAEGVDAIGTNCGVGAEQMLPICRRLRQATELPLWIKPNAGLPELVDGKAVYRTEPEEFAQHLQAIVEVGAELVGGCCGTGPDYLAAARQRLRGGEAS